MVNVPRETIHLQTKDFLVTNEVFDLLYSKKIEGLLVTHPKPDIKDLSLYYKSEAYVSHKKNGKSLLDKVYFLVKYFNAKYKQNLFLRAPSKQIRTLDYGCGVGDFVSYLNKKGYDAYGIEPNPSAYKTALEGNPNKIFPNTKILETHKFDIITLYHVLEHIPNLEQEIIKIKSALKPNGELYIAVPNYKSYDAQYYKQFWAAYDVPRHLWHFSDQSIKQIFEDFGMIIESIKPLWFDAFYISIVSERYKNNKLGIFMGVLIGFISNLKSIKTQQYSSKIYRILLK